MRHNYPKVFSRLSGFFKFVAWMNVLGALLIVVAIFRKTEISSQISLSGAIGLAAGCFVIHYVLDFLLDLSERLAYFEQIQQQQNKVLTEIRRAVKETETLPS